MGLTLVRLVRANLGYHRRLHAAAAAGIAAATAVIVGALLVGDSVRGSLRELTLDRLGQIDEVLLADHLMSAELAEQFRPVQAGPSSPSIPEEVLLFASVTVEARGERTSRVNQVTLIGCRPNFWDLGNATSPRPPALGEREIILNEPLAEELGVRVGDEVTVRLPKVSAVPTDSPLAHRNDRISGLVGLRVSAIVPARGLGQFRMQPSQQAPRNAFLPLTVVQEALGAEGRVNAILFPVGHAARKPKLSLDDLGVRLKRVRGTFTPPGESSPRSVFEYDSLSTGRMVFSPESAAALVAATKADGGRPVLTYLANRIQRMVPPDAATGAPARAADEGAAKESSAPPREFVPYSMVSAIDPGVHFPLRDLAGRPIESLRDDEIVLNSWTAEQLGAQVGDPIRLTFFDPETTHGRAVEREASFTLRAVTPLVAPSEPFRRRRPARYETPPAIANDPDLTPEVEGVTEQDSMDDWDAPFPFDYRLVTDVDETYWADFRTTPKAFVTLDAGQRLWGSRFGNVTTVRLPSGERMEEQVARELAEKLGASAEKFGLSWVPVRQQQLDASSGTTPFDVLFLSLSFFVIASALLLVAILFRLGIERRAVELGILGAIGLPSPRRSVVLLSEGIAVSLFGAACGTPLGMGYAWLMLAGLRSWWVGAITTPFLQFHATGLSLVLGFTIGVGASLATIAYAVRKLNRVTAKQLISGQTLLPREPGPSQRGRRGVLVATLFVAALILAIAATQTGGMAQAGQFVAAGGLVLVAELLVFRFLLESDSPAALRASAMSLSWLGMQNNRRHLARTTATIAMVAVASFLIVALSSFRLAPTDQGTGGFQLVAQSSEPVFLDLNDPAARRELLANKADLLEGTRLFSFRLQAGDDASCNNLYQAAQPRILGVTRSFIEYFDGQPPTEFKFAGVAPIDDNRPENPWRVLGEAPTPRNGSSSAAVPVVLDKHTALYSLHLYRGIGEEFELVYGDQPPVRFRVAGLLENSILQGTLLIAESQLIARFPDVSGYRFFLIQVPSERLVEVSNLLEDRFSDEGFDTTSSVAMLERFLAVQNTYLSTFQSLGALGLLLGTFGLAAIQLRNVFERRRELAVMRATGFRPRRLMWLVIWENVYLLVGGLGCGVGAAFLVVLPHKFLGEGSIPLDLLRDLGVMLGLVLLVGLLTSIWASRSVLRAPLLSSLRGD